MIRMQTLLPTSLPLLVLEIETEKRANTPMTHSPDMIDSYGFLAVCIARRCVTKVSCGHLTVEMSNSEPHIQC